MYLVDIDTVVANLAGIPAISVPAGFASGLPVGVQLMADEFQEQTMLGAASLLESTAGVQGRSPDL
jgi:aspartyl-tRNA(Asn)/glutamyl-tRNA(Gln) amidotransferase subunit A